MDGIAQDIGEFARCLLSCKESPQATWLGSFGVWISSDVFLRLCEHQSGTQNHLRSHVRLYVRGHHAGGSVCAGTRS